MTFMQTKNGGKFLCRDVSTPVSFTLLPRNLLHYTKLSLDLFFTCIPFLCSLYLYVLGRNIIFKGVAELQLSAALTRRDIILRRLGVKNPFCCDQSRLQIIRHVNVEEDNLNPDDDLSKVIIKSVWSDSMIPFAQGRQWFSGSARNMRSNCLNVWSRL